MEKYTIAIIENVSKMIYDLQYLAKNDKKTLSDLTKLQIVNTVYDWADWYHISEPYKIKLERMMNKIIFSNSNLKLPRIDAGIYYSNANTPSNPKVWQRVYDNPDTTTWELVES